MKTKSFTIYVKNGSKCLKKIHKIVKYFKVNNFTAHLYSSMLLFYYTTTTTTTALLLQLRQLHNRLELTASADSPPTARLIAVRMFC